MIRPDSPVSSAFFNTTLQVYIVSEHKAYYMHITCIFENDSPHYARLGIINLGYSGEFQGSSGEIR